MKNYLLSLTLVLTLIGAQNVSATVTIFTSEAEFLAAAGTTTLENFETLDIYYPSPVTTISTDNFDVTTIPTSGGTSWLETDCRTPTDGFYCLSAGSSTGDSFNLAFSLNISVNAVGFYVTDFEGYGGTLSLETGAGDTFLIASGTFPDANVMFFGIIDDTNSFDNFTIIKESTWDGILVDKIYLVKECNDSDGDGYYIEGGDCGEVDCDDSNASTHPDATEVCNSIDDNCDGSTDEGFDSDSDGYTTCGGDCDDTNSSINPDAIEVCNGEDDDCDTEVDEGVKLIYHPDTDSDGFGDPGITALGCTPPSGYVSDGSDCDDSNAAINPGATEVCNAADDNCDGTTDEGFDSDSDGYTTCGGDCNDTDSTINPGAPELCNGKDDDCDTETDEGVLQVFYLDSDGDGFGDIDTTISLCEQPSGYVTNSTDCQDNDSTIYPGASEICNGVDEDCDTEIDEEVKLTFYFDADGDGYGDASQTTQACTAPSGYVSDSGDCDETRSNVNPGVTEVCNDRDDNCNEVIDEGVLITFYLDVDGDGYGDLNFSAEACTAPSGYVSNSTDCNDDNALISPAVAEICSDHIDNDCDQLSDCDDINCSDELICASDVDNDGVQDFEEMGRDGIDSTFDGDGNGTPDYMEDTTVSCYTYGGDHYITMTCPMGFVGVNTLPIPLDPPQGVTFPYGFFEFTIDGIADGASAVVTFYLDDVTNTFYKFGPTIVGTWEPDWYPYLYDSQLKTGAQFDGLTVTVHYVDGAIGDDDLTINGTIVDQGGPGVITSEPTPPSGGGGGGCSIVGVKMSISDALAGYGLLIVAGVLWGIRRRGK